LYIDHISLFEAFLTPANAMLSVELTNLADILDAAGQSKNVSDLAREWSGRIGTAIMNSTVRPFMFIAVLKS
jgi:meiotically up-regulated gene 157 (Mug157) protein